MVGLVVSSQIDCDESPMSNTRAPRKDFEMSVTGPFSGFETLGS